MIPFIYADSASEPESSSSSSNTNQIVGWVVEIKDTKSFIRAAKRIHQVDAGIQFEIIGPTDEDPVYFEECKALITVLNLQSVITFKGSIALNTYYKEFDLVMLTSLSEAQPLVLMEAGYYKVPCIATNVGSCSELLLGRDEADIGLGVSGIIVDVGDTVAMATAAIDLLNQPMKRKQMGDIARKRIQTYYDEQHVNFAYYQRYQTLIKSAHNNTQK